MLILIIGAGGMGRDAIDAAKKIHAARNRRKSEKHLSDEYNQFLARQEAGIG